MVYRSKQVDEYGCTKEISIHQVPKDRHNPTGYKFRLYYGRPRGPTYVLYDVHPGKGTHRHYLGEESPYTFTDVERLIRDFERDVKNSHESENFENRD